jgi:hypothetical protein
VANIALVPGAVLLKFFGFFIWGNPGNQSGVCLLDIFSINIYQRLTLITVSGVLLAGQETVPNILETVYKVIFKARGGEETGFLLLGAGLQTSFTTSFHIG